MFDIKWHRIVLDEAHEIKNEKTIIHTILRAMDAEVRWALSATPIQNDEKDLFALANWVRVTGDREILKSEYILRRTIDQVIGLSCFF
jgi:SNF2 family DNA or RNA helicase